MVKNGPNNKKKSDGKNVKRAPQNINREPQCSTEPDPCCCATPNINQKGPAQKKNVASEPMAKHQGNAGANAKHQVNAGTSTGKPKEKCTIQVVRKCCPSADPNEEDSLAKTGQPEGTGYRAAKTQTIDEQQHKPGTNNKRLSKNMQTQAEAQPEFCGPEEEMAKPTIKCTDENKCKHFKEQGHPLMLRYRAVLVDAKPTLLKLSEARFDDPTPGRRQTKTESIQAAPPPAVKSTCTTTTGVLAGDIEEEFNRMKEDNIAILWIIGYTQASVAANKRRCLNILTQSNNLGIINIEKELQDWYDSKKRHLQEPDDLHGKILYQGKRLAQKVIDQKMPLTLHELCQSFKLAITANRLKNPDLHGFFLDNFPVNVMEGEESEEILIQSVVCLYFESKHWTEDKSVPPKTIPPKLKIRPGSYSENAAEAAADHFGYKTIKILNSEELEEIQIHDIDSLVKKHLEGQGLELHKIAKHVHKHRDTNPDGTSKTVTEFASKVIVDHRDFVEKNNKEQRLSGPTQPIQSKEMTPVPAKTNNTPKVSRNSGMDRSAAQVASDLPKKQLSGQSTKPVNDVTSAGATSSGYYTATGTARTGSKAALGADHRSQSGFMQDNLE